MSKNRNWAVAKDVWKNQASEMKSDEDFFKFFNQSKDFDSVEKMGYIDFFGRIFTPDFFQILNDDTREKTSLEIGFGGGRLLNPASKIFKKAIGVDIHSSFDRTKKVLKKMGCDNFELFHRDEMSEIEDNSVDFVYSFIVFQHFDKWSEVEYYLKNIQRVLSKNGCGIIYFGTNHKDSSNYLESGNRIMEERGYTLVVNQQFALDQLRNYVAPIGSGVGPKRPWDLKEKSCQFWIKFVSRDHKHLVGKE